MTRCLLGEEVDRLREEVEREAKGVVYVAEILYSLIVHVHPSVSQFSCNWIGSM